MTLQNVYKPASLALIYLLLSACAAISPEKCKTADWFNLGYSDGQSGYKRNRINEYRQTCA